MKIRLPIGTDLFRELRENGSYYVDKTGLIKELLEQNYKVNLITRPRRFGKTLTMSMLAEFFDIRKDSRKIFEGLEISYHENICKEWMNQWPVLFMTLKDVIGMDFEGAYGSLKYTISKFCIEHSYLEHSEFVDIVDRQRFIRLKAMETSKDELKFALDTLIRMTSAHYKKPVILLLDEYDVPLANASDGGYYKEMLDIIRSFIGNVWKTNETLKLAVVTGCLRIAKESIFTGANNFVSNSVSGERYHTYFGFLESEVQQLLDDAGLPDHIADMKCWYDGYLFGNKDVYCPWDVLNHVGILMLNPNSPPASYWKDTSHNGIIRRFLDHPQIDIKDKFETLLSGGIVQEPIVEDLTYDILHSTESNLWSILYLTGYLTKARQESFPEGFVQQHGKVALRIPNEEIKTIFADKVAEWFADSLMLMDRREFFSAWWNGEDEKLTEMVSDILLATISYYDYQENFYHAFMAGLFVGVKYGVISNPENGLGRPDLIIQDRNNSRVLIIEVKHSKKREDLEKDCLAAVNQIESKKYAQPSLSGFRKVVCYGAAFFEKECRIKYLH